MLLLLLGRALETRGAAGLGSLFLASGPLRGRGGAGPAVRSSARCPSAASINAGPMAGPGSPGGTAQAAKPPVRPHLLQRLRSDHRKDPDTHETYTGLADGLRSSRLSGGAASGLAAVLLPALKAAPRPYPRQDVVRGMALHPGSQPRPAGGQGQRTARRATAAATRSNHGVLGRSGQSTAPSGASQRS